MIKSILAATALAFGVATFAHAAPIKPSAAPAISASDLVEVGRKWNKRKYRGSKYRSRGYYGGGYYAGRNYRRAPRGWRSYSYRPWGWQRRGCIVVGPVWYCP